MMTRKDFVKLAQELNQITDPTAKATAVSAAVRACRMINPRFSTTKFLAACGLLD